MNILMPQLIKCHRFKCQQEIQRRYLGKLFRFKNGNFKNCNKFKKLFPVHPSSDSIDLITNKTNFMYISSIKNILTTNVRSKLLPIKSNYCPNKKKI